MSSTDAPPVRSGREVRLTARPRGLPREADFAVVEAVLPEPGPGQVLVRNTWISVDPSARVMMHEGELAYGPEPTPLETTPRGEAVGRVVESRAAGFAVGDAVRHGVGWRELALLDAEGEEPPVKIEVDETTPDRAYLGALGVPGLTSYVGMVHVGEPREGEVVFVSAAAGSVGALALQIAKLRGARVIGSAGSPEKAAFLLDELGADVALCYRDGEISELLGEAAPDGIDLYFDNVGGDHLQAALDHLRPGGRVTLCGAIGSYNGTERPVGPDLFVAIPKQLTIRGFNSSANAYRMDEFQQEMRGWLADGRVVYPETHREGIEQAPRAFVELFSGGNVGKALVQVG